MPAMLLSWGAGRWAARWRDGNRNVAAPERLLGSVDTVNGKRGLAPSPGRWNGCPRGRMLAAALEHKRTRVMVPRSARGLVPRNMIASGHRRDNFLTPLRQRAYSAPPRILGLRRAGQPPAR